MIHNLLGKYELLFDGTSGTQKTKPVDMELQIYKSIIEVGIKQLAK